MGSGPGMVRPRKWVEPALPPPPAPPPAPPASSYAAPRCSFSPWAPGLGPGSLHHAHLHICRTWGCTAGRSSGRACGCRCASVQGLIVSRCEDGNAPSSLWPLQAHSWPSPASSRPPEWPACPCLPFSHLECPPCFCTPSSQCLWRTHWPHFLCDGEREPLSEPQSPRLQTEG